MASLMWDKWEWFRNILGFLGTGSDLSGSEIFYDTGCAAPEADALTTEPILRSERTGTICAQPNQNSYRRF